MKSKNKRIKKLRRKEVVRRRKQKHTELPPRRHNALPSNGYFYYETPVLLSDELLKRIEKIQSVIGNISFSIKKDVYDIVNKAVVDCIDHMDRISRGIVRDMNETLEDLKKLAERDKPVVEDKSKLESSLFHQRYGKIYTCPKYEFAGIIRFPVLNIDIVFEAWDVISFPANMVEAGYVYFPHRLVPVVPVAPLYNMNEPGTFSDMTDENSGIRIEGVRCPTIYVDALGKNDDFILKFALSPREIPLRDHRGNNIYFPHEFGTALAVPVNWEKKEAESKFVCDVFPFSGKIVFPKSKTEIYFSFDTVVTFPVGGDKFSLSDAYVEQMDSGMLYPLTGRLQQSSSEEVTIDGKLSAFFVVYDEYRDKDAVLTFEDSDIQVPLKEYVGYTLYFPISFGYMEVKSSVEKTEKEDDEVVEKFKRETYCSCCSCLLDWKKDMSSGSTVWTAKCCNKDYALYEEMPLPSSDNPYITVNEDNPQPLEEKKMFFMEPAKLHGKIVLPKAKVEIFFLGGESVMFPCTEEFSMEGGFVILGGENTPTFFTGFKKPRALGTCGNIVTCPPQATGVSIGGIVCDERSRFDVDEDGLDEYRYLEFDKSDKSVILRGHKGYRMYFPKSYGDWTLQNVVSVTTDATWVKEDEETSGKDKKEIEEETFVRSLCVYTGKFVFPKAGVEIFFSAGDVICFPNTEDFSGGDYVIFSKEVCPDGQEEQMTIKIVGDISTRRPSWDITINDRIPYSFSVTHYDHRGLFLRFPEKELKISLERYEGRTIYYPQYFGRGAIEGMKCKPEETVKREKIFECALLPCFGELVFPSSGIHIFFHAGDRVSFPHTDRFSGGICLAYPEGPNEKCELKNIVGDTRIWDGDGPAVVRINNEVARELPIDSRVKEDEYLCFDRDDVVIHLKNYANCLMYYPRYFGPYKIKYGVNKAERK